MDSPSPNSSLPQLPPDPFLKEAATNLDKKSDFITDTLLDNVKGSTVGQAGFSPMNDAIKKVAMELFKRLKFRADAQINANADQISPGDIDTESLANAIMQGWSDDQDEESGTTSKQKIPKGAKKAVQNFGGNPSGSDSGAPANPEQPEGEVNGPPAEQAPGGETADVDPNGEGEEEAEGDEADEPPKNEAISENPSEPESQSQPDAVPPSDHPENSDSPDQATERKNNTEEENKKNPTPGRPGEPNQNPSQNTGEPNNQTNTPVNSPESPAPNKEDEAQPATPTKEGETAPEDPNKKPASETPPEPNPEEETPPAPEEKPMPTDQGRPLVPTDEYGRVASNQGDQGQGQTQTGQNQGQPGQSSGNNPNGQTGTSTQEQSQQANTSPNQPQRGIIAQGINSFRFAPQIKKIEKEIGTLNKRKKKYLKLIRKINATLIPLKIARGVAWGTKWLFFFIEIALRAIAAIFSITVILLPISFFLGLVAWGFAAAETAIKSALVVLDELIKTKEKELETLKPKLKSCNKLIAILSKQRQGFINKSLMDRNPATSQ